MMICEALAFEAVVPFSTMSSVEFDRLRSASCSPAEPMRYALLRLDKRPTSETDVVDAIGEIVTRVGSVFSRWELHQRHDDALIAGADMSPIAVRPFAPFPCVVRLFGGGREARSSARTGESPRRALLGRALAALAARACAASFGVFFVVPLAWLVLAPTKTDSDLLTRSPLAVGTSTTSGSRGRTWMPSAATSIAAGWRIPCCTR